tara:strand:+ start:991 stop:1164 length:174 start_codon:yes stop_codon:yes gene_type:complete
MDMNNASLETWEKDIEHQLKKIRQEARAAIEASSVQRHREWSVYCEDKASNKEGSKS